MQNSNNDEASVTKTTGKPPLPKRSKTISDDTHFPGPLFPAVRRTDKPFDLRVSIDSDAAASSSSLSSSSLSSSNGFNERDWMYPSFLGPHMGRRRIKVKPNKLEFKGNEEKKRIQELGSKKEEKAVASLAVTQSNSVTQTSSVTQLSGRTRGLKSSLMTYYMVSSLR